MGGKGAQSSKVGIQQYYRTQCLKKSTLAVFFSVRVHLMEGETTWITSGGLG